MANGGTIFQQPKPKPVETTIFQRPHPPLPPAPMPVEKREGSKGGPERRG